MIEGFVLAGGQSRRMGQSKPTLLLGGKTLLDRAAGELYRIADPVFAVGNFTTDVTSLPIIEDELVAANARGAIIGLYTALFHAKTEWAAILACDLPFVNGELLTRMMSVVEQFADSQDISADAVFAEQPDGRIQPLCGLFRPRICLPEVLKMINEGNWRLQDLATRLNTRILRSAEYEDLPGANHFFLNVNNPDDYLTAIEYENTYPTKDQVN
ncbi:MAG TPA: molybdenum cofactor guanylyltransferase [Pyrinomonadaceae bacterium]|nr:molybdenum cofactor guanylyltransferase [Pyrinomonadaceae bacterium]